MKRRELYEFIMDVFEKNPRYEFSGYHPLYKGLSFFPKNHAIMFIQDYIDENKCTFIPKLKPVKIIKDVSMQYNLEQKTLIKAKELIDECILELELSSITTDKKEKPSEDYYDGFY